MQNDDLGLLFHGKCLQTGASVIVRYIRNKQLIKSTQHLQLVRQIFLGLNQIHQGIVQTYDCLIDEDGLYFIREELIGADLQQIAFSGDYPHLRNQKFILKVGSKVCEILTELHRNKIINRRIQPSNIFLVANDLGQIDVDNPTVKLLNLEYAQINGQNILGFQTIPYAKYYSSPEQVLQCGVLVNETSDIYSLGMTLNESISREHVFDSEKDDNNLILNTQVSFPLHRHHRVDKKVFPLLLKATSKHIFKTPPMRYNKDSRLRYFWNAQKMRYQSASEMQQALDALIQELPDEKENKILTKFKSIFRRS